MICMPFSTPAIIWSVDWKWENGISRPHIVFHCGDFKQIISQANGSRSWELWRIEAI
jgi:hypothetical protein